MYSFKEYSSILQRYKYKDVVKLFEPVNVFNDKGSPLYRVRHE